MCEDLAVRVMGISALRLSEMGTNPYRMVPMPETTYDLLRALSKSHAFIGLDAPQLAQIEPLMQIQRVSADEVVVEMNARDCDLHLILEGELRVVDADGSVITDLGAGASVGEVALMDQQPRSATVIAKTDSVLAVIPAMQLWHLMEKKPEIGKTVLFNIGRVLASRLRSANERV
jgi:CRP-like cAMP-binding protein